jgi:hypothetical protein
VRWTTDQLLKTRKCWFICCGRCKIAGQAVECLKVTLRFRVCLPFYPLEANSAGDMRRYCVLFRDGSWQLREKFAGLNANEVMASSVVTTNDG